MRKIVGAIAFQDHFPIDDIFGDPVMPTAKDDPSIGVAMHDRVRMRV